MNRRRFTNLVGLAVTKRRNTILFVTLLPPGSNTTFVPLHGERDEEHQFGLQIPFHGWLLDADTFKTRANNFLDHSNIGESSIFIPVTVQGALIQGWEVTLHSPRLWRYGQVHLAYSNQLAQQRGPITGGLVCYPPDSRIARSMKDIPPWTTISGTR